MLQDTKARLAAARGRMSTDGGEAVAGSGPAAVGAEIRAAREALGWSIEAVAAALRIRQPYLESIEAGRVKDLPGSTYAMGFLRAYASAVGLDPETLGDRFRAGSAEVNRRTELAFPAPVPQRGMPAGAVVLLGMVIVVGAYVGWYRMSSDQHTPAQTVPEVPERLAVRASGAVTPSPQVASILPTISPPSPPLPGAAAAATVPFAAGPDGGPAATGIGTAGLAAAGPVTGSPVSGPTPAAITGPGVGVAASAALGSLVPAVGAGVSPPATASVPGAVTMSPGTRIVLKGTESCWIMVREKGGKVLVNETLHPDDTWPVPVSDHALLLSVGNARALAILVDGVAVTQLQGTSRRDLPLDVDDMQSGKLVAAPVPAKPKPLAAAPVDADNSADALNARQLTPH